MQARARRRHLEQSLKSTREIGNDQQPRSECFDLFEQHAEREPIGKFAMDERDENIPAVFPRDSPDRGFQLRRIYGVDDPRNVEYADRATTLASKTRYRRPFEPMA